MLALMAGMASIALIYALNTQAIRRSRDPKPVLDTIEPRAGQRTSPADLVALRYLPANTNVIAALAIAEALQSPIGQRLAARYADAADPDGGLDLEKNTGLRLKEIDHVVLGFRLPDQDREKERPRLVLIIQTLRPYSSARVREALKANRPERREQRTYHRFSIPNSAFSLVLWEASKNTLVIGLSPDDLDEVPTLPRQGLEHVPAEIRNLFKDRMASPAHAWAAADVADWSMLQLLLPLLNKAIPGPGPTIGEEDWKLLRHVRTFGAWVELGEGIQANEVIRANDEEGAQLLEKHLTLPNRDAKLPGASPDGETLARELVQSWKVERQGSWIKVQTAARPDTVQKVLPR